MLACGKRVVWQILVVFSLMGLVALHDKIEAQTLLSLRLATMLTIMLGWRYVVDALIARGWVHPMRRSMVLASRWRVLGLIVLLELFVIQQLPQFMVELVRH